MDCTNTFQQITGICAKSQPLMHVSDDERNLTWVCPNGCGRSYMHKGNLSRHLKFECGVPRKFSCNLCGKKFAQKENFKTHQIMKHKLVSGVLLWDVCWVCVIWFLFEIICLIGIYFFECIQIFYELLFVPIDNILVS